MADYWTVRKLIASVILFSFATTGLQFIYEGFCKRQPIKLVFAHIQLII